jgi:hypothetical protein
MRTIMLIDELRGLKVQPTFRFSLFAVQYHCLRCETKSATEQFFKLYGLGVSLAEWQQHFVYRCGLLHLLANSKRFIESVSPTNQ